MLHWEGQQKLSFFYLQKPRGFIFTFEIKFLQETCKETILANLNNDER